MLDLFTNTAGGMIIPSLPITSSHPIIDPMANTRPTAPKAISENPAVRGQPSRYIIPHMKIDEARALTAEA